MLVAKAYVVERARVLRNGVQLPAKSAERAAINTVRMRGRIDIWARLVDGGVDHVRGAVKQTDRAAVDDLAFFVDEDEV